METIEDVEKLEKIVGQLQAAHAEITVLAKKTPADTLNSFKLKMINKVIEESNKVLGEKYKPFEEFDKFEEDDLPSNSDVTMVLAQYMEEAERYRSNNVIQDLGSWYYIVDGKKSKISAGMPSKVGKK
jgi:phage-related tail protein